MQPPISCLNVSPSHTWPSYAHPPLPLAGEESHSSANQCLLKVAGHATELNEYKKAIEIYEQVRVGGWARGLRGG